MHAGFPLLCIIVSSAWFPVTLLATCSFRVAVTMAKGIGNGFPMAAVVTTPEIASSLQHAQHFNTFGGGPLACAVASTVLDVSDPDELLQWIISHLTAYNRRQIITVTVYV